MKWISIRTHTIIGLIVGIGLLFAPWLFDLNKYGGAVVAVPVYVGIFILVSELTTTSPLSPLKFVPMRMHVMLDVITGLFLVASPWLFGFSDLPMAAWMPHVIVGIVTAGYALATRTADEKPKIAAEVRQD